MILCSHKLKSKIRVNCTVEAYTNILAFGSRMRMLSVHG